jgi:gas vesicle protein
MASSKKIISGAALGTLLGSLAAVMYPKRREIIEHIMDHAEDIGDIAGKAREYGEAILSKTQLFNSGRTNHAGHYLKGGLVGFLIGAGTALLIAPKSGKNLRGQLARAYNDLSERSEEFVHHFKNNTRNPFAEHRPKKKTMRKAHR